MKGVLAVAAAFFIVTSCTTASISVREGAEVYYNLGNAYTELGRQEDALKAYSRALELDDELFSAGYNLARIKLFMKNYQEGISQLEELLANDQDNSVILETLAWGYNLRGDTEKALELYMRLSDDPGCSGRSLYNTARLLYGMDRKDEALDYYLSYRECSPDDNGVIFDISELQYELGFSEDALLSMKAYLDTVDDEDEKADEWVLYGDILSGLSEFGNSLDAYSRALELAEKDSEQADINFRLAELCLTVTGEFERGIGLLDKALELGYRRSGSLRELYYGRSTDYKDELEELFAKYKLDPDEGAVDSAETESGDEE